MLQFEPQMSGYNQEKMTSQVGQLKDYNHHLFDCIGAGLGPCLITWLLPCYTYALIEEKLMNTDSIGLNFCLFYTSGSCFVIWQQRKKIAVDQHIEYDGCKSCCASTCCGCCVLLQSASQVDAFQVQTHPM